MTSRSDPTETAPVGAPASDVTRVSDERPPNQSPSTLVTRTAFAASAGGTPGGGEGARLPSSRYRLEGTLGAGGMGIVYRAFDTQLGRRVALKFVRDTNPGDGKRFLREARAQARVEHPNICQIYDVAEIDGQLCIAMQLVEGGTCRDVAPKATVEQKARLMRTVALALQAAHTVGLIHRDIKPGNILVEETEDGLDPILTDFGLARVMDEPGLTRIGEAVGSPSYMAPEQARGDLAEMDRRTDVYGVGATLYELLAGQPPFTGANSFEVMTKVVDEEPPPLRRLVPSVPKDLETIVMKCLEKSSARRYDSAKALADDLGRFLAGEPLSAERSGSLDRLRRKTRKHPVVTGLVTAAAVVAIVSAGIAYRTFSRSRERERVARVFGQEVERIVTSLRLAYLLPLHDVRAERHAILDRLSELRVRIESLGPEARGPGFYALGRGALALRDDEVAEKELKAAWAAGFQEPDAAFALGQVLGYRYQKLKTEAQRIPDQAGREARLAELRRTYRDPAVGYLSRSEGLAPESAWYIKGRIALYEEKYEKAASLGRRAFETNPGLYEARVLEAEALRLAGFEKHVHGDLAAARESYEESAAAFAAASNIARSEPRILTDWCLVYFHLFEVGLDGGVEGAGFGDALATAPLIDRTCGAATAADPSLGSPFSVRALEKWKWGKYVDEPLGIDPSASYQRAMDLGREAVKRKPDDAPSHTWIGAAALYWSEHESDLGRDPSGCRFEAAEAFEAALRADPYYRVAYNASAVLGADMGSAELDRGRDPRTHTEWAITNGRKALQADPTYSLAHDSIARSHTLNATYLFYSGLDETAEVEAASAAIKAAQAIRESQAEISITAAGLELLEAARARKAGHDPGPALARAKANALAAGGRPGAALLDGRVELARARWDRSRGVAPGPSLEAARRAFRKELEVNPRSTPARVGLSESFLIETLASPGRRAGALRDGLAATAAAIRFNPGAVEARYLSGLLLGTDPDARARQEGARQVAEAIAGNGLLPAIHAAYRQPPR